MREHPWPSNWEEVISFKASWSTPQPLRNGHWLEHWLLIQFAQGSLSEKCFLYSLPEYPQLNQTPVVCSGNLFTALFIASFPSLPHFSHSIKPPGITSYLHPIENLHPRLSLKVCSGREPKQKQDLFILVYYTFKTLIETWLGIFSVNKDNQYKWAKSYMPFLT